MTSLSTRSSNAIKLAPGKSNNNRIDPCENEEQTVIGITTVGLRSYFKQACLHISSIARHPEAVLIYVSSLCVFFALLSLRVLDDNRLTSWQWIFSEADLLNISLILLIGLMLAWYISAIKLTHNYFVPILFLLSYSIGILHWSSPEVIVDAARYFTQAKFIEIHGISYFISEWGREIMAWTDLPLVPFIYGLIFQVAGESRTGIQVVNTLFFSGSVIMTYCIGKILWNERVGFYGALMLLAIPYLHTQVPLMLVDVPAMFFLSLAVFIYTRSLTRQNSALPVLAAVCIVLAMLTKYSTWLMLSILPVISLVIYKITVNPDARRLLVKQNIIVLASVSAFLGLLLLWKHEIFVHQIGLLIEYQLPALSGWSESHLSTYFFQTHPFVSLAALSSLYIAYQKRDLKYLIIGWMILLILILDIRRIRYALIVFPMLSLMAGYALASIKEARIRRYLTLCILLSAGIFSITGFSSFIGSSSARNIQAAAKYIDSIELSTVEVITLPQTRSSVNPVMSIPLFDLYSQKQVIYRDGRGRDPQTKLNNMQSSPLRFTWEYTLPDFYQYSERKPERIIAVISNSKEQEIPGDIIERLSGYKLARQFITQEEIYRYKTIVDIYLPAGRQGNDATL
jgi:4-amino-4-deoxy-L-arabinose transferase-like glycosyltransferase